MSRIRLFVCSRKLTHGEFQNLTYCDFCKHVRSARIAVCRFYNLRCSGRKVKTYFSSFIVDVVILMYCFVLVCSGGDFFVFIGLLQFPRSGNTGIHRKSGQLVHGLFVSSLCATGAAVLVSS